MAAMANPKPRASMEDGRYSPWYAHLSDFVTGEAIWLRGYRWNGSPVVIKRAAWTGFVMFVVALGVEAGLKGEFAAAWVTTPAQAWAGVLARFGDRLPWLGAMLAGAYVGFQSRFSAQWTYLAGQFNAIQCKVIDLQTNAAVGRANVPAMVEWKTSFVADAWHLHLARARTFRYVIYQWLSEPAVAREYARINGRETLETELRQLAADQDLAHEDVESLLHSLFGEEDAPGQAAQTG